MTTTDKLRTWLLSAALALTACTEKSPEPSAVPDAADETPVANAPTSAPQTLGDKFGRPPPPDTTVMTFGRGTITAPGEPPTSFTFDVNFSRRGGVTGAMQFSRFEDGGKLDVVADVTCGALDSDKRRAWIGGKIDANRSTLDAYKTDRYNTGKPIWFRFVESQTHPAPVARISPPRFAGDDKVKDVDTFCEDKGWLAGDAGVHAISADGSVIIFEIPEEPPSK